jgi:hypothetical protein
MFQKLDVFLSSGDGGEIYSDGSLSNLKCNLYYHHTTCVPFSHVVWKL